MKLYLLSIFIFVGLLAFGQESKVTPYPMEKSSLLWEISGPGVKKGCYLFGTMHLIEKEYFIFPKKLKKIVGKSDQLVMEIAGLPDQMEVMKYVMLEEGSFFDIFNEEQIDSIIIWAEKEFSMTEETFRANFTKMRPFTVVQMATQLHFMGKTESYELTFEEIAVSDEIKIIGLETLAEQMAIFDNLSDEQQVRMVMEGVRSTNESIEITTSLMKLYATQEIDSLYMMIDSEGGVIKDEQSVFLDNRNNNWVPQIETLIKNNRTFIAVGAAHLGGPNGVIRLLEARGYTLKPIQI